MKKTETIKENRTFRQIYRRGRSAVTLLLVRTLPPTLLRRSPVACSGRTMLGARVARNRARRRLREVYRLAQGDLVQGFDIIAVARGRAVDGPYDRLTKAFYRACRELGLLERT